MQTAQQEETLDYFNRFAQNWRDKAEGWNALRKFNVIAARNNCALHVGDTMEHVEYALDVGCGTGELVIDWAKRGIKAIGIDFAPDMIKLCVEKAQAEQAPLAEFVCASIYDYLPEGIKFDLIAANGFIEYVSDEQFSAFLDQMKKLLSPRGRLVVGSRNRLFNIVSFNAFTDMERKANCLDALVDEAMLVAAASDNTSLIAALEQYKTDLPRHEKHPATEIGVSVRHQYTPAELVQRFQRHGLRTVGLYPVHYHGLTPTVKAQEPEIHVQIANLVQALAYDRPSLIPLASTFMVDATHL